MIGKTHVVTKQVGADMLASAVGSGSLDVFATPSMIALMEQAASELLQSELGPDQTSVGTGLVVEHLAATPSGVPVQAIATITAAEDRKVEFEIAARDMSGEIGRAKHTRFIVNAARFQDKADQKAALRQKTRVAVFDMDGTILDTLPGLVRLVNHVLVKNGQQQRPAEEIKHYISAGLQQALPYLCEGAAKDDAALHEQIRKDFREARRENIAEQANHFAGMPELIDRLCAHGITNVVLTNKPEPLSKALADHFFPGKFQHVFGASSGGSEGGPLKPDAGAMQRVFDATGCTPQEILYVGDSDIDMLTAKNAKVFSVGVLWGFCDAATLLDTGASVLAERPQDIWEFVVL